MPVGLWNIEWLNSNSQRSYPLAETATKVDQSGALRLPDSLILALYLPVHAGLDVRSENFFIRRVVVYGPGLTISVAYNDDTASPPIVATAVIPIGTHSEYDSYVLAGAGDFDDSIGKIVIGNLDEIRGLGFGEYVFDYNAGKLDTDTIRPMLRAVTALVVVNGQERSARLVGDIEFVAGANVVLSVTQVAGQDPQIRIDAIDGEGLNDTCECEQDLPCIRTISGVSPDDTGNIDLVGDDCLIVTPGGNSLALTDECSAPCCGCDELEAVTRDLEQFGEAARTLTNFYNRLEAQVAQMNLIVLGSRLGDRGCDAGLEE